MTDTSEEAAKARAQEQLTAAMASIVTQGNIEAEAAERRKREEKRAAEEAAARQVGNLPIAPLFFSVRQFVMALSLQLLTQWMIVGS